MYIYIYEYLNIIYIYIYLYIRSHECTGTASVAANSMVQADTVKTKEP